MQNIENRFGPRVLAKCVAKNGLSFRTERDEDSQRVVVENGTVWHWHGATGEIVSFRAKEVVVEEERLQRFKGDFYEVWRGALRGLKDVYDKNESD